MFKVGDIVYIISDGPHERGEVSFTGYQLKPYLEISLDNGSTHYALLEHIRYANPLLRMMRLIDSTV